MEWAKPSSSSGGGSGVRYRTVHHNTVSDVLREREGWRETESELGWDVFWADTGWCHDNLDKVRLGEHQRVNHFRNHYELTRKDLLVKNLKRMKKALEKEGQVEEASRYDFFPQTYVLPAEYNLFVEEFKRRGGVWIMKPIGKAQGKGIFLFHKLSQISEWKQSARFQPRADGTMAETYVVQRYVENPLLVGGKKFDLRIYVLVLSYSPLRVYLYRSGFARFSGTRFSMARRDIDNVNMHLTNIAIQKTTKEYDKRSGMKWDMRSLRLHLQAKHGAEAVDRMHDDIQLLIVRSLLSVANTIVQDRHCFELYGYDIILDDRLKPLLIEVNASPALSSDTEADYVLKTSMLHDVFDIIDMDGLVARGRGRNLGGGFRRREEEEPLPFEVGGFDLIWDGGPVVDDALGDVRASALGCFNEAVGTGNLLDDEVGALGEDRSVVGRDDSHSLPGGDISRGDDLERMRDARRSLRLQRIDRGGELNDVRGGRLVEEAVVETGSASGESDDGDDRAR